MHMAEDTEAGPASLLPYDDWTEDALRLVVARALERAGQQGLPGEHHFYVTFRTDHPGVSIPARLKAEYPEEITIVLQHQFWDLVVDATAGLFSVGLSFGGVPATLRVPLAALTGFADPHVRFGLRFRPVGMPETSVGAGQADAPPEPEPDTEAVEAAPPATPQVISLDAFRRRPTPKE